MADLSCVAGTEKRLAVAIVQLLCQLNSPRQTLIFRHSRTGVNVAGLKGLLSRGNLNGVELSFFLTQQANLVVNLFAEMPEDYEFTHNEAIRVLGQSVVKMIVRQHREAAKSLALAILDLLVNGWTLEGMTEKALSEYASPCAKPLCGCRSSITDRNVQLIHQHLPAISTDARTIDRSLLFDYLNVNDLGSTADLIRSYALVSQTWAPYMTAPATTPEVAYSSTAPVRFG